MQALQVLSKPRSPRLARRGTTSRAGKLRNIRPRELCVTVRCHKPPGPGGKPSAESEDSSSSQRIWEAISLHTLIVPGVCGSLAVALGYLWHINPYGPLHWSLADARTGLTCAVPLMLFDLALMWLPFAQKKTSMPGEHGVLRDGRELHALLQQHQEGPTLFFHQRVTVCTNGDTSAQGKVTPQPPAKRSFVNTRTPSPLGCIDAFESSWRHANGGHAFARVLLAAAATVMCSVTKQLMSMAFLTGWASWVTERLHEAGGAALQLGLNAASGSVADAGSWVALSIWALLCVAAAFSFCTDNFLLTLAPESSSTSAKLNGEEVKLEQTYITWGQGKRALVHVIAALALIAQGSSYILTGNLLAPVVLELSREMLYFTQRGTNPQQWQEVSLHEQRGDH